MGDFFAKCSAAHLIHNLRARTGLRTNCRLLRFSRKIQHTITVPAPFPHITKTLHKKRMIRDSLQIIRFLIETCLFLIS